MNKAILIAILVSAVSTPSTSQESPVTFFPSQKIFPVFTADALSHQLSISRVTDNRDWIGTIGASLPLTQAMYPPLVLQLTTAATVFSRLTKTPGHVTVVSVDYRVDFPVDVRIREWVVRVAYGHLSSHYADDGIEQLGKVSIPAVKDYIDLGIARDVPAVGGFVYISSQFNYHNEPRADKKWILQWGGEFGNINISDGMRVYGAVDLKVKEEVGWGTTRSYQVGVKTFERNARALRIALTHRSGFEERGQLFDQVAVANLVSLALDF